MQKFVVGVLLKVLQDPKTQAFLLQMVDRVVELLLPKLASVIPAAVAAGIKAFGGVNLPDLDEVAKAVHDGVNQLLPEDIDIPILSDAFESLTGIDLTDILTGRKRG